MRKYILLLLIITNGCRRSPQATQQAGEDAKLPTFYLKAPASTSPLKISREYSADVKAELSRITWNNIESQRLSYQDFREAALVDVALTRQNGAFGTQLRAIRSLLMTHSKTALGDVMSLLLECSPKELFPPGANKWAEVPGDAIMEAVNSSLRGANCVPPPKPLNGGLYTIDNLPGWKRWWEDNKEKIPTQWPAN